VKGIASWRPITFYKNSGFISRFPETNRIGTILSHKEFDATRDNLPYEELEENVGFFPQMQNFFLHSYFSPTYQVAWSENSEYSDMVLNGKNTYLSTISVYDCENIFYSFATREWSTNVFNSTMVFESSNNVYESKSIISSSNIFFSHYLSNCYDMWFCSNCIWCSDCIACDKLENQTYCIKNKQYSKEEYDRLKDKILSDKWHYTTSSSKLNNLWSNNGSTNVVGSFLVNSTDITNGYYSYNIKTGRNIMYMWWAGENENMYDIFVGWAIQWQHFYAVQGAWNSEHIYCSIGINDSAGIFYSMYCSQCSFCLWCIGLQNKQFCILNKQYSKEEWHQKVDEIFAQMEQDGTLWEFFPPSMNPFYFNDTAAYLIDPTFTKEEVTKLWYLRRDEPIKVDIPASAEVVQTSELDQYEWFDSQWKWSIHSSILKKIIIDTQGNYYRIVQMEYDFLVKHGLPLPRKHWLDRLKKHFDLGLKQWS